MAWVFNTYNVEAQKGNQQTKSKAPNVSSILNWLDITVPLIFPAWAPPALTFFSTPLLHTSSSFPPSSPTPPPAHFPSPNPFLFPTCSWRTWVACKAGKECSSNFTVRIKNSDHESLDLSRVDCVFEDGAGCVFRKHIKWRIGSQCRTKLWLGTCPGHLGGCEVQVSGRWVSMLFFCESL